MTPHFQRILVKLSGEALAGDSGGGVDPQMLLHFAQEVAAVHHDGVQTGVVIGGGNFFRGAAGAAAGMDRAHADQIGMLATIMNGLFLRQALEDQHIPARVLAALPVQGIAEPYSVDLARAHLDRGRVVILVGGTGNPYFSTDTAASLRALEIGAQLLLKGTKVDGVYDADPKKDPTAKKFTTISYREVLQRRLAVMDLCAITLCEENRLPLVVFDIFRAGDLRRLVCGQRLGTLVTAD